MTISEEFARVSRKHPCPVCGKATWCMVARESDPSRTICQRVESSRRWGTAGWLHDLHDHGDSPTRLCEIRSLTWVEEGVEHEVYLRFSRWTKHGKDRLYVAAMLSEGGIRELGNYDLVQDRWYTKGTIKDLSRERQDATKALVLGIVAKLGSRS